MRSPFSRTLVLSALVKILPSGPSQVTDGFGNPWLRQKSRTSDPINSSLVFVHILILAGVPGAVSVCEREGENLIRNQIEINELF